MEIKILCECGAKFKFDVEPIDGRSPGPVNCPSCGRDQTAATDSKIREQLAAAPPLGAPKRISILPAMPGTAPAPAPAPVAAPAVKISAVPAPAQVSPKMAVMEVPATVKALSVKAPGDHGEEASASPAPAQVASNSPAPGSPKMAKMEVPTGGTALSVAGHAKKEGAPAAAPVSVAEAVSTPVAAPAHPAAARMAAPPAIPRGSGAGMGVFGAIVGAALGAIVWYFIAMNSVALTLLMVIPGVAAGFMARLFARRANQTVAVAAAVIAAVVVALTEMAVLSGLKEKFIAEDLASLYEERMALAKKAAEARNDEQVREVMIEDPAMTFSSAETISDEAVSKYRRNEMAALVKFAKGEPTRARFEETERRRMEQNDELAEVRVRWIGTLIWGFTAVSAAFKIAGGASKD